MKSINKVLAALTFITWVSNSSAAPITGTNILKIDGTEWAQVDLFTNLSWYDINSVCPSGVCIDGGTLHGYDMTDWHWASAADFNAMFNLYLRAAGVPDNYLLGPDVDFYGDYSSSWATAFFSQWRPTDMSNPTYGVVLWGSFNNLTSPCCGIQLTSNAGVFDRFNPDLDGVYTNYLSPVGTGSSNTGGWFYRGNSPQIPVPATLWLLSLGLVGIGWSRRMAI